MIVLLNPDLPNLEELRFGDGSCYGFVGNDDNESDNDMSFGNESDNDMNFGNETDNDMNFGNETDNDMNFENETLNKEELINQPRENENKDSEETNNTLVKTVIFESSYFSFLLFRSPQTSYHLCRV